ncbi:hypothetical protein [Bordetella genomosp. 11]|uniref:hypothetical protein n=1 Tax=Bordetella genomosp. 11 TaxID=1416808 RepID=UPI0015958256|nr:hypothetical protein [Bordetella genomosp. 11]
MHESVCTNQYGPVGAAGGAGFALSEREKAPEVLEAMAQAQGMGLLHGAKTES